MELRSRTVPETCSPSSIGQGQPESTDFEVETVMANQPSTNIRRDRSPFDPDRDAASFQSQPNHNENWKPISVDQRMQHNTPNRLNLGRWKPRVSGQSQSDYEDDLREYLQHSPIRKTNQQDVSEREDRYENYRDQSPLLFHQGPRRHFAHSTYRQENPSNQYRPQLAESHENQFLNPIRGTSAVRPSYDSDYVPKPYCNKTNIDFKPRMPTFDGKPDTWEPFMMQLQHIARTYRWTDQKFREQLLFALKGEALMFVSDLSWDLRENTNDLVQAIEQCFGQCLLAETHRANLYSVKKHSKESLQQYCSRIRKTMSRAYPGMQGTPIFENLSMEHLLRGLPDQKLAYEVLTRKPKDLSEAVDMITWHEACRQHTMKTVGIRNIKDKKTFTSDMRCINDKI